MLLSIAGATARPKISHFGVGLARCSVVNQDFEKEEGGENQRVILIFMKLLFLHQIHTPTLKRGRGIISPFDLTGSITDVIVGLQTPANKIEHA